MAVNLPRKALCPLKFGWENHLLEHHPKMLVMQGSSWVNQISNCLELPHVNRYLVKSITDQNVIDGVKGHTEFILGPQEVKIV